jgi:hypothetical protein
MKINRLKDEAREVLRPVDSYTFSVAADFVLPYPSHICGWTVPVLSLRSIQKKYSILPVMFGLLEPVPTETRSTIQVPRDYLRCVTALGCRTSGRSELP